AGPGLRTRPYKPGPTSKSGSRMAPGPSVAAEASTSQEFQGHPERSLLRKLPGKRIVIRSVIIGPLDPGNERIPTGAVRACSSNSDPHLIAYLVPLLLSADF